MTFLEFCQSLLDSQLPDVVNAILPHLLKVIVQADLFSIHTRTRAVHIYNVLSGLVFSLDMSYPVSVLLLELCLLRTCRCVVCVGFSQAPVVPHTGGIHAFVCGDPEQSSAN